MSKTSTTGGVILKGLSLRNLLKRGEDYYKKNDYKNALEIFKAVIEEDAHCAEAFFYMANIFHIRGEIGKAVKSFHKVLEIEPDHTEAAISLSVILNDIGKYDSARDIFEKTNEQVKSHSGEIQDTHLNKKFALKHYELAESYVSYCRYDEAIFEYKKAIGLDPQNFEVRINLAKVYARKGFILKGIEELRRLRNEEPSHLPARLALGLMYYSSGSILEAQTEWEKVLDRDANNSEALMYLQLSRSAKETNLNLI
ncbi:MAG: tetratricopeptide repeat protein [Bacteriovoracaceae bacterium]|nr:tetratricopeptide repeat protein [Bacteriovoracaceae bacterium]